MFTSKYQPFYQYIFATSYPFTFSTVCITFNISLHIKSLLYISSPFTPLCYSMRYVYYSFNSVASHIISPILFLQLSQPSRRQFHYSTYLPMNSFCINSVLVLVVVDLVCIYPLLRYPQTRCSLHHQNQSFQALYP